MTKQWQLCRLIMELTCRHNEMSDGITSLMHAVQANNLPLVQLLIKEVLLWMRSVLFTRAHCSSAAF
jgi:ankyrin repeat protein